MLASCQGLPWKFCAIVGRGDPGGGRLRLDAAAQADVAIISLSDACLDARNPDVSLYVGTWDKSTNIDHRGTLLITCATEGRDAFAIFDVVGTSTDHEGWTELAVRHVQGSGAFENAERLSVQFYRTGNTASATTVREIVRDIVVTDGGQSGLPESTRLQIEALLDEADGNRKRISGLMAEIEETKRRVSALQGALAALHLEATADAG